MNDTQKMPCVGADPTPIKESYIKSEIIIGIQEDYVSPTIRHERNTDNDEEIRQAIKYLKDGIKANKKKK